MINWSLSRNKTLKGIVQADQSTKKLLQRLRPGTIAVIAHDDLDDLAAQGLKKAKVKAVVNAGQTMTGRISSRAVLLLFDGGIPVFEIDPVHFGLFGEEMEVTVTANGIALPAAWIPHARFSREHWLVKYQMSRIGEAAQLGNFVENTLSYAEKEKNFMLKPVDKHEFRASFAGRDVVVVVRGRGYQADLACLREYIRRVQPILVGVDGGADALMEQGYKPDMIVGDMDSVSDRALNTGAELIVHAYRDGTAPGLARLEKLGLKAEIVAGGGTSEDLALLLAYDQHCEQIVTVGLHSHMQDFLEKGRHGMGSTWLVRMKVGHRLIDATGISQLYPFIIGDRENHLLPRSWSVGWFMHALRDLWRFSTFQHRKEGEAHGPVRIGHHSRLE